MLKNIFKSKKCFLGLRALDWLILGTGVAVYVLITLATITKFSVWFDEAFGYYLIRYNYLDIARYTATDVHPPLFYWALKTWSLLFGYNDFVLRSMSTFFGVIAIFFGYKLINKLFNSKAARISLVFMVLAPMFVRYGQEARMYTMVAAIAMAATYVLTIAMKSKKKLPWVVYGLLVGAGMLTHYFTAIIWITHWIWRSDVVRRVSAKGEFIKKFFSPEWIVAHIVALGLFAFWLPFFAIQLFTVQAFGFWIPSVTPGTPVNFLTNVVYYKDFDQVTGWMAFAIMALLALLFVLAIHVYRQLSDEKKQSYRLIVMLAFVPMIVLIILSMPPLRSVFIDRYLITSVLAIGMFTGLTVALGHDYLPKKVRWLIILAIAGLMIIGINNVYILGNYNKNSKTSNNTRDIIWAVDKKSPVGEPIITSTPWLYYESAFYSTDQHPVYFIAPTTYMYGSLDMLKYSDYHKIQDIDKFSKSAKVVWYVDDRGTLKNASPSNKWVKLQEIDINDSVSGLLAYRAVQYRVPAN